MGSQDNTPNETKGVNNAVRCYGTAGTLHWHPPNLARNLARTGLGQISGNGRILDLLELEPKSLSTTLIYIQNGRLEYTESVKGKNVKVEHLL